MPSILFYFILFGHAQCFCFWVWGAEGSGIAIICLEREVFGILRIFLSLYIFLKRQQRNLLSS